MSKVTGNASDTEAAVASPAEVLDTDARLSLFDASTARQRAREAGRKTARAGFHSSTRDKLYERGGGLFRVKDADTS